MTITSRFIRSVAAIVLLAGGFTAAGCGWAQWPPENGIPLWSDTRQKPKPIAKTQQPAGQKQPSDNFIVVGRGDTLYALARRTRVSPRALIEANNLQAPYVLQVGQRLVRPGAQGQHTVRQGDTLYGISRQYGVGADALAKVNSIKAPYTITIGQRLRLPATVGHPGAARPGAARGGRIANRVDAVPLLPPLRNAVRSSSPAPAIVPVPPPVRGGGFAWPVRGPVLASYGPKTKGLHNDGINISAPRGTPVRAAENGVVAYAGNELRGYGNLLLVKHANGWVTAYAHNREILVRRGAKVAKGQIIARVGTSGNVTKPQLHFEMRKGRRAVDPQKYLKS